MSKRKVVWIAVLAAVGGVSSLVWRHPGLPFLAVVLVVAMLGEGLWAMGLKCARTWPEARHAWLRTGVRVLRWFRRFYRAAPGVAFVAPASYFLLLGIGLVALVLSSNHVLQTGALAWSILIGCMGAVECIQRTRRLMALAWARAAGRLILLGWGAVVCIIAHIWATHLAYDINPLDPKFFPNFIALSTTVLTPLLYLYGFATLIAVWSLLEFSALFVLYIISQTLRMLAVCVGRVRRHDMTVSRLVYGRRPVNGHERELLEDGQVFFLRTFSMNIFVVGIFLALGLIVGGQPLRLRSISQWVLVAVDYRPGAQSGDKPSDSYLPIGHGLTSIAHRRGRAIIFGITSCSDLPQPPAEAAPACGLSKSDMFKGDDMFKGKMTR